MILRDLAGLSAPQLEELQRAVAGHRMLEHVARWGYAQTPFVEIRDVVEQDEFTHDVIVPLPDGLVLVYDST